MGVVLWRIVRAAAIARDALGSLICYGVAAIIFFQTVVSIGMNLNVLPVTGLTLPFISSGGSSLLTLLVGIGIVQSVIMRRERCEPAYGTPHATPCDRAESRLLARGGR